jgi:predicted metalloprotease with PDZ domain
MKNFILLIVFFLTIHVTAQNISYKLSMSNPHTHYFEVEMTIENLKQPYIDVKMPTWAPGSYLIREFSKSVEDFNVTSEGKIIPFEIISKNTWRIESNDASKMTITYKVYAFEMSVRTSFLDESHGYVNGTSIFMYVESLKNTKHKLQVIPHKDWKKVSVALPKIGEPFIYEAADYDVLVDSPIEIGNHNEFNFTASGVIHTVAMFGQSNYDIEVLKKDMTKIVESCTSIFGENPNKNYLFIIHHLSEGSGGLEHLNSTTLQVNRFNYHQPDKYKGFLSLVAHEYFHLWNVKRLRPENLGPFDYDNENYTTLLWISEGFTSYYDQLLLLRSSFYSPEKYLSSLSGTISRVENQPGNKVQSLSESSFHTWIKSYRPNENSYNTTISYYPKGAIIGAVMDLMILQATNGEKKLDDLLRLMYQKYYKENNVGFSEEQFKKELETICNQPLDEFFEKYINHTDAIDYNKYLNYAGCQLKVEQNKLNEPTLGIKTESVDGKLIVKSVTRGYCGFEFGINVNDEIIAINNFRVSGINELNHHLNLNKVNDKIDLTFVRDGLLMTKTIALSGDHAKSFSITRLDNPTKLQEKIYQNWLK